MATTDTSENLLPIPFGPTINTLNFYTPPLDGSRPFTYVDPPPPGLPVHNHILTPCPVRISDIRTHPNPSAFSLATHGFQPLAYVPSACHSFTSIDDPAIVETYYPEIEALLFAHVPGASRVVIFDHTLRSTAPCSTRAPVARVHIDQTPAAVAARVRRHAPDEADALLKRRYRLINIWRPLNGPVESWPLAVADKRSVKVKDLVEVEVRANDRKGETYGVRFNEGMQWWYLSAMRGHERLLLQCFDSAIDNSTGKRGVGGAPHCAFEETREGGGGKVRESIEVRALVFDDGEDDDGMPWKCRCKL